MVLGPSTTTDIILVGIIVGVSLSILLVTLLFINKRLLSGSFLNLYIETSPYIFKNGNKKLNKKFFTNILQVLVGYVVCFTFAFIFIYYFIIIPANVKNTSAILLILSLAIGITITIRYVSLTISTILGETLWNVISIPSLFLVSMFLFEVILLEFGSNYIPLLPKNLFIEEFLKENLQKYALITPITIGIFSELFIKFMAQPMSTNKIAFGGGNLGLYRESVSEAICNIPIDARLIVGRTNIYENLADMINKAKKTVCGTTVTFNSPEKYKSALNSSEAVCRYIGPLNMLEKESTDEYEERMNGFLDRLDAGVKIKHHKIENKNDFRFFLVDSSEIAINLPGEHNVESQTSICFKNREIGYLFYAVFEKIWGKSEEIDEKILLKIKESVKDYRLRGRIDARIEQLMDDRLRGRIGARIEQVREQ